MSIWIPIALLVAILTTVYFRQWFMTARAIREAQELQKTDIALLLRAKNSVDDLSSLMIALRVKLFGPDAAKEALLASAVHLESSATLPASVVSSMKRHSIRLVSYRQTSKSAQMQFEGNYDGIVRFLNSARPDLPRLNGFLMERGEKNLVKLTVSFAVTAV